MNVFLLFLLGAPTSLRSVGAMLQGSLFARPSGAAAPSVCIASLCTLAQR